MEPAPVVGKTEDRRVPPPTPVLTSLSPAHGGTTGHTTVTLTGTGFAPGLLVTFGERPARQAIFISPTQATAITPGQPERFGSVDVTLINPDGLSATLRQGFRYHAHVASFAAPVVPAIGTWISAVLLRDMNGDGQLDLITGHQEGTQILVALGRGDGTFSTAQAVPAGPAPATLAAGDIDGDGRADLVTADSRGLATGSVTVLLGLGDGSIRQTLRAAGGPSPYQPLLADLNGDGKLDLAVNNRGQQQTSVLFGNGDSTFGTPAALPVGTNPHGLGAADLDGNGHLDLVVSNEGSGTVSVLLNQGKGMFRPADPIAVGAGPQGLALGDLNGDRIPDLAIASSPAGAVSVLPGKGDGTFGPTVTYAVAAQPVHVLIEDLNGDGRPDLVVASQAGGSASVLPGRPDGGLGTPRQFRAPCQPVAIAAGDLDRDTRPDLVLACHGTGVAVLRNESR